MQTPPGLFGWLNRRFLFDYDAFASKNNYLAITFSTIEGTYTRAVLRHDENDCGCDEYPFNLIDERDGLTYPWSGRRVFMNPPYSRGLIEKCIEKAYNERNNAQIIVALIPASTETQWFQCYIIPYCHVEFLPRRVRFIDPSTGQPGPNPPSGSVIAIFRQDMP